jgi:hypothetical protein
MHNRLLGPVEIGRLPVAVRDFAAVRKSFGRANLAGALPLAIFERFLTTLDFPGQTLRLRLPTAPLELTASALRVPFLLLQRHLLLVQGRVNDGKTMWLFADTGFSAGGFLAPKRTLVREGIVHSKDEVDATVGLTVRRLAVGPISQDGVPSMSLVFPEELSERAGFEIGGLVSNTFFRPYRMTWDFTNRQLVFQK